MHRAVATLALAILFVATPLSAQRFGPQPDSAAQQEILALREQAWRTWFANDRAGFERVVPDELIALGWDGGVWGDREQTLADMASFATSGMTLTTLEFPRNVFQQYGDAVILYTRFRLVLTDREGAEQEITGRGTEVFVRRNGRWIHTGWHLDQIPNQRLSVRGTQPDYGSGATRIDLSMPSAMWGSREPGSGTRQ